MPETTETKAPCYPLTDDGLSLSRLNRSQLPPDWGVAKLGAIAAFRTGPFGSALHKSDYVVGGVPLINPMHIVDGELAPDSDTTVSESAAKKLSAFRLRLGDIVMGRRGDMGRCAVVNHEHVGWLCGTGSIIIRCTNAVDAEFIQRVLTTERVVAAIVESSVGSTMTNLNQRALSALEIQVPPLEEQREIASALTDADASIKSVDALIIKKQSVKQAAMRLFLAGQVRLPGFRSQWQSRRLSEIGGFLKGNGIRRDEAQSGPLACVRYGEIYTTHHDYIREFQSWISSEVAAAATRLQFGDVLFAGSGETKEEIGKCVAFVAETEAYAGGDIVILRPRGVDSLFLGYALNSPEVARQKASLGQGDAVVHVSASALGQVVVRMPDQGEQSAIASVLFDLDAEIAALKFRRNKAAQIKQGMMQHLLTGRTRLMKSETLVAA